MLGRGGGRYSNKLSSQLNAEHGYPSKIFLFFSRIGLSMAGPRFRRVDNTLGKPRGDFPVHFEFTAVNSDEHRIVLPSGNFFCL